MEVVEGAVGDETSVLSMDMDRASDMDSVALGEDFQRSLPRSGHSTSQNRTLALVRSLLESGSWDQVLPRYEKQVLIIATQNERNWQLFLDNTSVPSASSLASTGSISSPTPFTPVSTKKGASASSTKGQKASSRSKRGTTTPRRRGADVETAEQNTAEPSQETSGSSREHVETLHTRLRTLIFDTLVDEVLFPHERYLDRVPVLDSIKEEFGVQKEPLESEPFFTLEDLKEARETLAEAVEKDAQVEYTIHSITDLLGAPEGVGIGPSAPVTPNGEKNKSTKRKLSAAKREVRNLVTDSKSSRKWERLDMLGASGDYKTFVGQMDSILQTLKDTKQHSLPFLKPLKESDAPDYKDYVDTPMDISTMIRNLDNMLYWTKANFAKDIALIFSNARAYYSTPDSSGVLNHATELETIAKGLLSSLPDSDFTEEKESLKEHLAQVLPDIYGSSADAQSSVPIIMADDANFDYAADAIKRGYFFKEDPSLTLWKSQIKQRMEGGSSETSGELDAMDVTAEESEGGDGGGSSAGTLSMADPKTSVVPDPLFELPKPEILQSQWRFSASPIYTSLNPETSLVRVASVIPLPNPSTVLPQCSAQRLVALLSHRNNVLLQRVKDHTTERGMAPLDPNIERPQPDPESSSTTRSGASSSSSSDEPRILLIEPSIKLVMPAQAAPSNTGNKAPGKAPSKTTPSKAPSKTPSKLNASQSLTNSNAVGFTGGGLIAKPETPGDGGDSSLLADSGMEVDIPDVSPEVPSVLPIFSELNMERSEPIFDDIPIKSDPASLTSTMLEPHVVGDLLKQTISVQLAMSGFQASNETPLNVLTDVVTAFIGRLGFVANTHLSSPGTLLTMPQIMDRTISEVFPRGIQSVKSFITSETLKSDNCLRLVDPNTVIGWVESSPTLASTLTPPPPSSGSDAKTPSTITNVNANVNATPDEASIVNALMTQLSREDKLDEKATTTEHSREYYLQQAPFAKRSSSYFNYRPLSYVGSMSTVAVGTPSGLHHVLPPNAHLQAAQAQQAAQAHQAAQAQAQAQAHQAQAQAQGGMVPHGHMPSPAGPVPHQGMHMQQGGSGGAGGAGGMSQGSPGPGGMAQMVPGGGQGGPGGPMGPNAVNMNRSYVGVPGAGGPQGGMPPNAAGRMPPQGIPGQGNAGPGGQVGGPKKAGVMPGTMAYPPSQHVPMGYAQAGGPSPRTQQYPGAPVTGGAGGYMPQHMGSPMPTGVPGVKKTGAPSPAAAAKLPGGRPRVDDPSLRDEPSPRGSAAKRKRPQTYGAGGGAASEEEDTGTETEGRRTRSRRGVPVSYGDEYYYDEEDFDDGGDGEPKRKKRKTPAKSAKR